MRNWSRRRRISTSASYCRKRYRFEESLRVYVRQAVNEPMPVELRQKLAALRIRWNSDIDVTGRTEVVAGDKAGGDPRAPSSGMSPNLPGEEDRMEADAVVAGGDGLAAVRASRRRRGRPRGGRVRPVGEDDDCGLGFGRERGEAAAERRPGAALPVRARDALVRQRVRAPHDDDVVDRALAQRSEHVRQQRACFGGFVP